jgi:hypothetical protein
MSVLAEKLFPKRGVVVNPAAIKALAGLNRFASVLVPL